MFPDLAKETLSVVGDPITFSDDGVIVTTLDGVFRNAQEMRKSKNKFHRTIDCDVVIVPFSDLVKSGQLVNTGFSTHRVAGRPLRDGSGGMIVKLESNNRKQSQKASKLDR